MLAKYISNKLHSKGDMALCDILETKICFQDMETCLSMYDSNHSLTKSSGKHWMLSNFPDPGRPTRKNMTQPHPLILKWPTLTQGQQDFEDLRYIKTSVVQENISKGKSSSHGIFEGDAQRHSTVYPLRAKSRY